MGSVCNREVEFFETCFAAFGRAEATTTGPGPLPDPAHGAGEPPWQVVLATGAADVAALGPVPANFVARPSVPQLEVLQRTDVFLTHGGMNSVMEALWHGVPLVVVPQMAEQAVTARRVEELGLGLALEKPAVTAASLREAVGRVAGDREMRARVRRTQETIRQLGGARAAADAVIRFSPQPRARKAGAGAPAGQRPRPAARVGRRTEASHPARGPPPACGRVSWSPGLSGAGRCAAPAAADRHRAAAPVRASGAWRESPGGSAAPTRLCQARRHT